MNHYVLNKLATTLCTISLLMLVWLLMVTLTVAGCSKEDPILIPLNVRLGWQVNANSAGQLAALELGYYAQEGLGVTFNPGGLDNPSVKTVAGGVDDIGFANGPDLVIKARAAGAPLRIVAAIQQRSYHGFMAKADSGITSPEDWAGKRIGVKYASPTYILYQVLLKKLEVDRKAITEIPIKYGIKPFLQDDINVYPGAFTNEAIAIEQQGFELNRIVPADYGVETYGNVIFTTESMIAERPDILAKFVRATIKGWKWCLKEENHSRTIQFLRRHNSKINNEKELQALNENIELVRPGNKEFQQIGQLDPERFHTVIKYLVEFKVINAAISNEDLLDMRFLPSLPAMESEAKAGSPQ